MFKRTIFILTLFILALPFVGCNNKSNEDIFNADPAFTTYISAYTSGIISNQATIRILLANEINGNVEFGKPISEELFDFTPDIQGTTVWLDKRTIEFRPTNRLPSDQVYKAEFYLSKVVNDIPNEFKTFEFGFKTIQQSFEVSIDGTKTIDKKTLRWQRLSGTFTTADAADNDIVAKLLSATQDKKKLKISWEHDANNTTHHFSIDSIARTETAGKVLLEWDGKELEIENNKGEKEIDIPAIGDFKVMDIKVIQTPEQYVSVQFSDPVQEKQNLDGLITISDTKDIKFIIEDNEIRVYPQTRLNGAKTINAETGIKNILGTPLKGRFSLEVPFEELKPQIKLIGKGVILPSSKGLVLPFQAVNLNAVDVKIIRIYEKNIPQFMQVNNLEGDNELKRVGKMVFKNTISLTSQIGQGDMGKWNTFSLDLASLIKAEPGAIYKVIIDFRKSYSTYHCDATNESSTSRSAEEIAEQEERANAKEENWDYYSSYYNEYDYYYEEDGDYDYKQRDNPCHSMYYRDKSVSKNIIASDIGMIAKRGTNGSMTFVVTNLLTTKPISGAEIEVYDFQQQIISTLKTNSDGICTIDLKVKPFLLIAKNASQRGYLKLDDGSSLSLSMFDVAGETVQKGIKGFIYGERGVWRPGDTLFLSFMLEDKLHTLPKEHPVTFEFYNPLGQLVKKIVKTSGLNGFYNFTTTTDKLAPTGNWLAKVKVGGATFEKPIKVETIMPNRLKINLSFGADTLMANKNASGNLNVKWLTGATARNLEVKVDVVLSQIKTTFKKFENYVFDDPAINFSSDPQTIFDSKVDGEGNASFLPGINVKESAPGMLKASFTVRAFEEGGNFSIDRFSLPYSPYNSYVGIKVPEGNNKWTKTLSSDSNHVVKIATLDAKGNPVSKNKLKVQIYKVDWRWWWQQDYNDLANYVGNTYHQPYSTHYISTRNGNGQFNFKVNHPDWGRFFIHVTDEESGHSTGQTVYVAYWPGSDDERGNKKGNEGASMLSFTTDKTKYNVGENIKLTIPSGSEGRAFISIENGSKVLNTYWIESAKGETTFNLKATEEMSPNVYVNVTLLQPHAQTINDLPIRMYGVLPIQVEDPNTHLTPIIKAADVWKPEEKTSITVSELNGKEMAYTIAVVDEGLLDLTRFKTPDPWNYFYAREALGVKTWDLYDFVIGAYGGELQRILAIGGDGDINKKSGSKANRFKPMVKFFGPFHLDKGKKQTHEFMMPQYVGSVRTMVIAGCEGTYGFAEKTTPVRKPLMVLGTLPRVVGPGESVDLPVTIFAMEKNVKNVNIELSTDNLFIIEDSKSKSISFEQIGDEVVNFKLKVKSSIGVGKVKIIASSGSEKAVYEIEIESRNPNPKVTHVIEATIEPGKSWSTAYKPLGIAGTNKGTLELSSVPPVNLGERLIYLIEYPHGCIEQTTSSVFPQLFLPEIMELNSEQKMATERNIKTAIERIRSFQTSAGGFSYWPGYNETSEWGTTYAGHFLLEAELKGYTLPIGILENWKRYQRQEADAWSPERREGYYSYNDDLEQAYRLYTLALAKSPEMGAMNRLKEYKSLSIAAKWRLAATYVLAGQLEVAKILAGNIPTAVSKYSEMSYTFGSDTRDKAMILEALSILNEKIKSVSVAKELAGILNQREWLSTQTTAYCLIGISKYFKSVGGTSNEMNYTCSINKSNNQSLATRLPLKQINMNLKGSASEGTVNVTNKGKGVLYARIILEGIPETDDKSAAESNLKMSVDYTKMDGSPLDVTKLDQGTDFISQVTLYNPGTKGEYKQLALSQTFPSGWDIHNTRMDESESTVKTSLPTYQDIRDDRVYTYFDLKAGEKKTFKIILNSSYIGRFYLPTVYCEAMYDNTINARKPGQWIEIVKPDGIN